MSKRRFTSKLLLIAVGLWSTPGFAEEPAAPSAFEAISREVRTVFENAQGAVVRIKAEDENGTLSGTGFFVDPNGTLFTTYSVGGEAHDLVVTVGENKYPARRVIADARSGIAVLKVEAATPFLKLGKSTDLVATSPVIVVGYPLELPLAPSFGIVAGFDSGYGGRWFAARHIRANVAVQRGEGGAPVFNVKGEVIGMLVSTIDQNSGIFALPVEAADKVYRDYVRYGRVRPGWLGVDVRETDVVEAGSSARIRVLRPDAPGHKGGLRAGDVITQVGEWCVKTPADVLNASFYVTADEDLKVRVSRQGVQIEFKVLPGDLPQSSSGAALSSTSPPHFAIGE